MSEVVLSATGIRKRYGGELLLDVARLDIEAGEVYALTGENGAGKSTLLRMLAGLEPGTMERLIYCGRPIDASRYPAMLRREIAYIHQHPYLFNTSVAANVVYGLKAHGVPRVERDARLAEAMAWAKLDDVLHVPPHRLSGGEKQRVALARAWVLRPRVYLLDEPTANLDAASRAQVLALIDRLRGEGCSVVIACHDREVIELPHMRRLHLEGGRIVVQGEDVGAKVAG